MENYDARRAANRGQAVYALQDNLSIRFGAFHKYVLNIDINQSHSRRDYGKIKHIHTPFESAN